MTRSSPRLFPWVQVLRAAAAGAVAWVHIAHDAITTGHDPAECIAAAVAFMPWTAGVDIFFVISGFIIVHASADLFADGHGWLLFLRRRLTRIVPLYWILTTLLLAMLLLGQSAVHGTLGGPGYIGASYLFIPTARPDGLIQPVLSVGWTLNYEMFFYVVMTPCLLLRRSPAVIACSVALCLLVIAGQVFPSGIVAIEFWSNPIVLEFAAGMGLALCVAHGLRLRAWLRLMLVGIALILLHLNAVPQGDPSTIYTAPPAVMLVCATVSGEGGQARGCALRLGVLLGDASYAMYLFHPFAMRSFTVLEARLGHQNELGGVIYLIISLCMAQAAAVAINLGIERRLTSLFRLRLTGRSKLG